MRCSPIIPLLAALLAAFCLPFLPGCKKTPEGHARIAKSDLSITECDASVEALAAAGEQALLADVAAHAANLSTQGAALDKLTDERLLADVVKAIDGRRDWLVTDGRMGKITDPQLLASLAREARSVKVRVEAARRLGDQALLADIARSDADASIRKKAIEKLDDQSVLTGIALNDRDESVRLEATRRVSAPALLASLAQDEKAGQPVRIEAISRLDDQRVLAAIAKTRWNDADARDKIEPLHRKAVERLADQQALFDVAQSMTSADSDDSSRAVVARITDQSLLAGLLGHPSFSISRAAMGKITDQAILSRLARDKNVSHMHDEIVAKLADQKLLAEIAGSENYFTHARMAAVGKLADPPALLALATNGKDEAIVWEAVKKIDAPQTLATLAADENAAAAARLWAVWRVAGRELLAGIAKSATDERVRAAAAEKLDGKTSGATPAVPQDITDLIKAGKILAEISGGNIQSVFVRLRKTVPWPLEVVIPAGTYFVCANTKAQNMVSTEDVRIALKESESEMENSESIPVACANRPKDIPGGDDRFTIGALPENAGAELEKLMATMRGKNTAYAVKQAAVWIVTDDADYNDLGKLVTRRSRFGDSPHLATSGRTIQEPETVAAMCLCAGAGVDIKAKTIWRDARSLHARLPAGELRDWLQTFGAFTLPTHVGGIASLLVTPDGRRLLTADALGDEKLWSLPVGKLLKTLERGLGYRHAVISPDGSRLVTEEGAAFSLPDGNLVQKLRDKDWDNWSSLSGRFVLSPDGSLRAGVARNYKNGDEMIKVFSLTEGVLLATLEPGGKSVWPIAINPDGKQLAAPGDGGLMFWSLPDGKLIRTLEKEYNSLISPDWKWRVSFRNEMLPTPPELARTHLAYKIRHTAIDLHNPADGVRVKTLAEYPGEPGALRTFTSDGKHLLVAIDRTVRLWSIPDGALLMTVEDASDCVLSPDGKLLVTREKEAVRAHRLPDGEILGAFTLPATVRHSAISPDNTLLVTDDVADPVRGGPGIVKLWSLPDGKLLKTLEGE
jgi:WD40 repeat protein